jgi:hypothetical protein
MGINVGDDALVGVGVVGATVGVDAGVGSGVGTVVADGVGAVVGDADGEDDAAVDALGATLGGAVIVGPAAKPIEGSGEKTEGSGVAGTRAAAADGDAVGAPDGNTTFTGELTSTSSGPMPVAVSVPSGPLSMSIFDWNFAPGCPLPDTE